MKHRKAGTQLEVARIQSEINRLFDTLVRLRDGGGASASAWTPMVDVAETGESLMVEVELPGVDYTSLRVHAQSGHLLVTGSRPPTGLAKEKGAQVLHDEREYGPFEQKILLGTAVNTHKAEARMEHGVLYVQLPKVPNRRGESVPIQIEVI